jgi:hypothetical protein
MENAITPSGKISQKYPQIHSVYEGDSAIEYWRNYTLISIFTLALPKIFSVFNA